MKAIIVNKRGALRYGFILVIAWLTLFSYGPIVKTYEMNFKADPSLYASVDLERNEAGVPVIDYSVLANQTVRAHFSAWLQTKDGVRHCSGGAPWTYNREKHNGTKRPFELAAWLAVPACTLPASDFMACVDYTNLTNIGAPYWGPFCSLYLEVKG